MPRLTKYILIALVCLACGSATCLYSGAGPMDPLTTTIGGAWPPWLAFIADALTIPYPTQGIADVRDVVLVMSLAIGLVVVTVASSTFLALKAGHPSAASIKNASRNSSSEIRPSASTFFTCSISAIATPTRWLTWSAVCVTVIAMASLSVSTLSGWGWVVRFVSGACWSILLARCFTPGLVRAAIPFLLAIGTIAILLGFIHAHDRGYAHLSWPIGPITITAALAGCWAAMAMVYSVAELLLRVKGAVNSATSAVVVPLSVAIISAGISLAAMLNTGRRSSAMGFIAALTAAAGFMAVYQWPRRITRWVVGIAFVIALASAIGYVAREATSAERIRSGPLQIRLTYLELSWKLIREHPLFGIGPDQFVVAMTNAMAPLRAVSPQVYHGVYDPTAHNEWVQVAVELGVPGAVVYAALPIGIIILALRRARGGRDLDIALTLAVGITAICVTEIASITLRGPIVPVWYWTLIGLLAGSTNSRNGVPDGKASDDGRALITQSPSARVVLLVAAAACLAVGSHEMRASNRALMHNTHIGEPVSPRLYFEKQLLDEIAGAADELNSWQIAPSQQALPHLVSRWQRLYQLVPGYLDTPARFAECLLWGKRTPDAKAVLEDALSDRLNPYEPRANTLFAGIVEDMPERLRCVQRALRSSEINEPLERMIRGGVNHALETPYGLEQLDRARRVAAGMGTDEDLRGPLIELLRISAFCNVMDELGDLPGALDDLRLVAGCYARLDDASHPYRRTHAAETDVYLRLARAILREDVSKYREAYAAIRRAERFAVMGLNHEDIRNPDLSLGYVGGEVVPTDFPEQLRGLWQLSAQLHLMVGDERFLDLRIFAGLPRESWTQDDLNFALLKLAERSYEVLSGVPPKARPKHYDLLPAMADHYRKLITQSPTSVPAKLSP